MLMELKCKQSFPAIIDLETDSTTKIDYTEINHLSNNNDYEDHYNDNQFDDNRPFITYRDIGIQTETPNMIDKAIQVSLPRSRRKPSVTRRSPNYIDGVSSNHIVSSSVKNNIINSHGLMPNIVYNGNRVNYYESPQFRSSGGGIGGIDLMKEAGDGDDPIYRFHNEIISELKINTNKRKNKSPIESTVNKITKSQLEDESFNDDQDNYDSTDLRLGLISENDDDPMDIEIDHQPLTSTGGGRPSDSVDVGLEIDDLYIFTHHPTGLCYQIFNGNRSINKEMMEKVFSSVIGKQDKFYVCLYPPHAGTCHSNAGKSTKIRVIKNHLTSHLFLYRCRLCGRTYKYYNNLFNHFNKHP